MSEKSPGVRDYLSALPEPDPAATERIWNRFRHTRARPVHRAGWPLFAAAGLAVGAAALLLRVERPREVQLDGVPVAWSDGVHLDLDGHGVARGTSRDLTVIWELGTLRVDVAPDHRHRVRVLTEEAVVEVTGTVFTVNRDRLGVTTTVDRGSVRVTCAEGVPAERTRADGPVTCWPVRAGGLLGRADVLLEQGAAPDEVIATIDRGLAVAEPGSAVEGELLARRVRANSEANLVEQVLADADRYLASADPSRRVEVLRAASRIAYRERGCVAALPYLTPLEAEGTAEDRVVLAACLPDRAVALTRAALASGEPLEAGWRQWAESIAQGGSR